MLKQVPNCPDCHDEDKNTETTTLDREPMLLKREPLSSATLSRNYIGLNTWQHSRRSLPSPAHRRQVSIPNTPTSPPPHSQAQNHVMQDGVLITELPPPPSSPTRNVETATLPKSFTTFRPPDAEGSPRNAYIISDGGPGDGGPYYFKLDAAVAQDQEHNHKPDVVSGHCAVCLANAHNTTLQLRQS